MKTKFKELQQMEQNKLDVGKRMRKTVNYRIKPRTSLSNSEENGGASEFDV